MRYFLIFLAIWATAIGAKAAPGVAFREGTPEWKILATEQTKLNARFRGYALGPSVQTLSHPDGTTSILLFFPIGAGPKPVLFRVSQDKSILWSNYEPLAKGGFSYNVCLAVNGDEDLLVWHDTEPRAVRARAFDSQGKPKWTTDIALPLWDEKKRENLLSLNATSWGQHGWGVVFSTSYRSKMQRLNADGKPQWKDALSVEENTFGSPISLLMDAPNTMFVLWKYKRTGPRRPNPFVFKAMRVNFNKTLVWPQPIDVGPAPILLFVWPREIELRPIGDDILAALYKGSASHTTEGLSEYQARISKDGQVKISLFGEAVRKP